MSERNAESVVLDEPVSAHVLAPRTKVVRLPRICRICDTGFVATHLHQYLCSDACVEESRRRHRAVRQASYRLRHPSRDLCRQIVKNAIVSGVVRRCLRCERCGEVGATEGHHEDYTKPFFVEWLCDSCHTEATV